MPGTSETNFSSDFWEFMENDFLDGIYWEEWYNQGDEPNKFPCDPESKNVKGNLISVSGNMS